MTQEAFRLKVYLALDEQLTKYVDVQGLNECWPWQGTRTPSGYGQVRVHGKTCKAHRVVYERLRGPIQGDVLMHLCNNSSCCNPNHLRPGTYSENALHREQSGRGRQQQGAMSSAAILTEAQVHYLRNSSLSHKELAKELGVSYHAVREARLYKTWRNIA